jgi:AcrR family transcriptional regulator
MTGVAARVGVSRQAIYKQIPGKTALGEAVIARETDRMLTGVEDQLRACEDPVAAITAAAGYVLDAAASPLIKAMLTDGRSGTPDLLPLVTTRPELVMGRAITTVAAAARDRFSDLPVDSQTIDRASEMIVRLTFSHLIQATGPADEALTQIRVLTEAILAYYLT